MTMRGGYYQLSKEREMTNTFFLALAFAIGMASMTQVTYAATNEPARSSEQMKAKPAQITPHHRHEHHSNLKVHRVYKAA
jgi:hypothetical protein